MLTTWSDGEKVWRRSLSVFLMVFLFIHKFTIVAEASSNLTEGFCQDDSHCGIREICNVQSEQCQCDGNSYPHEYKPDIFYCAQCPMEGEYCRNGCCFGNDVLCVRDICTQCTKKENGGHICPNSGNLIFATASQIALSAALIIGIAALATLLFRMCSKRSLTDGRRSRGLLGEDNSRFSSERASLSSIQIRILQRLRDRPPRYETRHNFNLRSQSHEPGIAPPSYDNPSTTPTTDTELPPPYTIAIGTPAFDNTGFMPDSPTPGSRSADTETQDNPQQPSSETSKSGILPEDDKAIHM
ncbi:hypothetical protein DMENIID0001_086730 [Sergentomyia squamirostris]